MKDDEIRQSMASIENRVRHVYNQGFEAGRKAERSIRMSSISDVLTVSFDKGLKDESAFCVARICDGKAAVLKMEIGEQADILYKLLTEQMVKAEIKAESEVGAEE